MKILTVLGLGRTKLCISRKLPEDARPEDIDIPGKLPTSTIFCSRLGLCVGAPPEGMPLVHEKWG